MPNEEIFPAVVFSLGPVEVTSTVLFSLVASTVLIGLAVLGHLARGPRPSGWFVAAEMGLEHLEGIMRDMSGRDPRPFMPLVATCALFVGTANLLGLVPGLRAPTADFSTAAALAAVVFLAIPYYGIQARGLRGYLHHYLEPSPLLLPLEIITELLRTITLAIRLAGNMISEELVIAVLLLIAGLLVPVPIMLLDVLVSVVQAYIFAILVMVYVSAVVRVQSS